MISLAPGECCLAGKKHKGEPQGEWGTIAGVSAYITSPRSNPKSSKPNHAILILTDGFGYRFPNAALIADVFATHGYFVIVPDLFHEDPIPDSMPSDFDVPAWLSRHSSKHIDGIVSRCLREIRERFECIRIGAVGYCIGAKYVIPFLRERDERLDVGYIAHPSFVEEDELKAVSGPLSIAAAETDDLFPANKRHETEEVLRKNGAPYQINLYGGVGHGFAVRGDPLDPLAKFSMDQALRQCLGWFDEYLKG